MNKDWMKNWDAFHEEPLKKEESIPDETIHDLLKKLPAGYPPAELNKDTNGYRLMIGTTLIFQSASSADAIKHTQNYVEAREGHPNLPVGVIYGIYD